MRRTQLYLDEDLWQILHWQARRQGATLSELVRGAVREKYLPAHADRQSAMRAWQGAWRGGESSDTETYLRDLRRGNRLQRLEPKP